MSFNPPQVRHVSHEEDDEGEGDGDGEGDGGDVELGRS
jgi:hypothetical protein